jgi:magnesium-transporting ATPase (P-type)
MGLRGTEAAKEAGEMVLTDDNFASIAAAVEEGRTVYDNLIKAIQFILPTNGGEALIIMAAVLFGQILPITPVQILWVNMVTAVTLALALSFEASESNVMARPPRNPGASILSGHLIGRIAFVALIIVGGIFAVFIWKTNAGASMEHARTMAVNTLVLFEVFYLFNVRRHHVDSYSEHFGRAARPTWIAVGIVMFLQLGFTHLPLMNTLFQSAPISASDWIICAVVASSVFIFVELEKSLRHRWKSKP